MRNMIKALKKKYALSDQGASDLFKGILYSVLANISLMLPVILLAVVLNQLLSPILGIADSEKSAAFYTITGIVILAVVFILHYLQYKTKNPPCRETQNPAAWIFPSERFI